MAKKRIAIFGGSYNPPGVHHERVVRELASRFDEVVIVPCGIRQDKKTTRFIDPLHRAIMSDLAFGAIPGVRVDNFDLDSGTFTPTYELENRYSQDGEVWHAFGTDLLTGHGQGKSELGKWEFGDRLWKESRFAVLERPGFALDAHDCPPQSVCIAQTGEGLSSTMIRRSFADGVGIDGMVSRKVLDHMERYGLYTGQSAGRHTVIRRENPKVLIEINEDSDEAKRLAERFASFEDRENPDYILVIGGDGKMLHSIRGNWRRRLPFVGINAGTRGYLMNSPDLAANPAEFLSHLHVVLQPMLHAEFETEGGETVTRTAFNDVWLERSGGQTAWLEVSVGDEIRIPRLIADGVLLATPAGSTAYARALGATPLLVDAGAYLIVGNNVSSPNWKSAVLSPDVTVTIRNLDLNKRPVVGYADGESVGRVVSMKVRLSRVAASELAFSPQRDMARKLMDDQFPYQQK